MKAIVLAIFLLFGSANSEEIKKADFQEVQIGDILKIGSPEGANFKYIEFPRANFIIKRGGRLNFKDLPGTKVEVISISDNNDGTLMAKIKRADGGRFFGSHTVVDVHMGKALESGEIGR